MEYLIPHISFRNYVSDIVIHYESGLLKVPSCNYINTLLSDEYPYLKCKVIKTELIGNILIPFYAARALYFNIIKEYQNYYEMWNGLKLPYGYYKFKN